MAEPVEWVAVDWGTSNMRAYAMRGGSAVAERRSEMGMGRLDRAGFEPALMELVEDWVGDGPTDVIACGMVGARQGWVEAPYAAVPCGALAAPVPVPQTGPRIRAWVVPGIKQVSPADVMRGEETQIAGFLSLNQGWDGVICLPGTHTKWAHVSVGEVVSFRTVMTGELFDLIAGRSVLRHSVAGELDDAAFDIAVGDALQSPGMLTARLFGIRARDLLEAQAGGVGRAWLSGLLIGTEMHAARPYWLGQQVAVVGASDLSRLYARALERQGVPVTVADGKGMTIAGLTAARKLLEC